MNCELHIEGMGNVLRFYETNSERAIRQTIHAYLGAIGLSAHLTDIRLPSDSNTSFPVYENGKELTAQIIQNN